MFPKYAIRRAPLLDRKRLRSYVLTRFQWFHTFVPSNPNVSKDGDKRNGHISSSRKTV